MIAIANTATAIRQTVLYEVYCPSKDPVTVSPSNILCGVVLNVCSAG